MKSPSMTIFDVFVSFLNFVVCSGTDDRGFGLLHVEGVLGQVCKVADPVTD